MQVSESGYYRWKNNKISSRKRRDIYLTNLIKQIHLAVKGRYGSPRIYQELKDRGEQVSRKRVNRLMRENNITAKVRRKFKSTTKTKPNNLVAPNLLKQNFTAPLPNQIWVADIGRVLRNVRPGATFNQIGNFPITFSYSFCASPIDNFEYISND